MEHGTNIQSAQLSMEHSTFATALFGFTFAVLSGICRAADSLILKYLSNNMSIIENIWSILFWSFRNQFLLSVIIMYFLETFTYLASCLEFYSRGLLLPRVAILYHCHSKAERKYIHCSFEFIYNFIHGTWTIHISEEYSARTSKLDRSCWNCASFMWIDDHIGTRIILNVSSWNCF